MSHSAEMNQEVVKTDKRYRRNLFIGYLCLIALGILVWKVGIPRINDYVFRLPVKPRVETLEIIAHSVLILFIPAALYLIHVGRKVCRYEAMPYPGMKVIHDTVVVRGNRARIRGWSMVVLGVVMILLVIASIIATHAMVLRMKHHPIFSPFFYGIEV